MHTGGSANMCNMLEYLFKKYSKTEVAGLKYTKSYFVNIMHHYAVVNTLKLECCIVTQEDDETNISGCLRSRCSLPCKPFRDLIL